MKKIACIILLILIVILTLVSCGSNSKITNPAVSDSIGVALGTPETFDFVTWNIENFPKHNPETVSLLKVLIPNLKVECIAVQEIADYSSFQSMVSQIPGWSSAISGSGDGYTRTGLMFNSVSVQVDSTGTLFSNQSNPFPRAPLIAKIRWQGQEIYLISVHLKAYGDNVIDESDDWDEEVRRRNACNILNEYIRDNLNSKKVIVAGDMNDQIQEPASTNVFMTFINAPLEYKFADMSIAQSFNTNTCSYPSMSHIDHILITNELFSAFTSANQYVKTINVENYVTGGLSNYKKYISDHRPVGARFKFTEQ